MRAVLIAVAVAHTNVHQPHAISESEALAGLHKIEHDLKDDMISHHVDMRPELKIEQTYHPKGDIDFKSSFLQESGPRSTVAAADWERVSEAKAAFKAEYDKAADIQSGDDDGLDLDADSGALGEGQASTDSSAGDDDDDSSFLQTADKTKVKDPEPQIPMMGMKSGTGEDWDSVIGDDNDAISVTEDDIKNLAKKAVENRNRGLGAEDIEDNDGTNPDLKSTPVELASNGAANDDGEDTDNDDEDSDKDDGESSLLQTKSRVAVDAKGSLRKE